MYCRKAKLRLPLKSIVEEYKCRKAGLMTMLDDSEDPADSSPTGDARCGSKLLHQLDKYNMLYFQPSEPCQAETMKSPDCTRFLWTLVSWRRLGPSDVDETIQSTSVIGGIVEGKPGVDGMAEGTADVGIAEGTADVDRLAEGTSDVDGMAEGTYNVDGMAEDTYDIDGMAESRPT
ncbi:hypothetical protein PoB_000786800 [Plakobranchus ocellatus]|uniref:Uncharacterized protein n=1 Tax=Plakobranchus ocellatus TaxID=259542 RepID=A0AAV3YFV8_9GAST|nr:hypothetical protein PoB_000786800 [Plakobranchus ocellatus]